ncbi:MAG: PIF1 family DEAD/DEAH box helicase [Patescibacteria group bacterium]
MTQDEALSILETGANVFLTGEPGSGKTHTVNAYVAWLREHDIEPAITASTGIAATHIGGYTIHSWSGIGIKRSLSKYDLDGIAQNKGVIERVGGARVLIIDEVSMLAGNTLNMVDAVCREVRQNESSFGGLQVVLVGDFFQLPPVVRSERAGTDIQLFEDRASIFAFDALSWEKLNPLVCYLSEQHRQEDETFLDFLSALRRDSIDDTHYELLRTRYTEKPADGVTQLYTHNADVDSLNDAELKKLKGDVKKFDMEERGSKKLIDALKRGCLSPERLLLKIGARVMFTKNDMERKYVNGTLGVVKGFAQETGYPIVKTNTGRELIVEPDEWRLADGGRVLARIMQIPLRLAWAMTVHKSQGMSLDAAHMDLSQSFEYGQGYVALSRVRTLSGLTLAGLNARALLVHPHIVEKDADFRAHSDAAREAFAAMAPDEYTHMVDNFLKVCGGQKVV